MNDWNGMGNMSTLEQKVDVLLRYCMAQTDAERQACCVDLQQLQQEWVTAKQGSDVRVRIEQVLRELGVSDHWIGYAYLCTAVAILLDAPEAGHAITTVLYPQVARIHKTVPVAVERSIRHAIETGWMRCDYRSQEKYFGNQINPMRAKPTNAQFINRVANAVRRSFSGLPS